jgi:molecular chaperone GrpE
MKKRHAKNYEVEISDETVREALESVEKSEEGSPQKADDSAEPTLEMLQKALAQAQDETKATRDRMLRVAADADNMRKRALKDKEDALQYGMEQLIRDLLPVIDSLDRAIAHLPEQAGDVGVDSMREGAQLVLRQFTDVLAKHHVVGFSSLGETFDPNLHEAIARTESTTVEPGKVVSELQKGYRLRDRLLRPALVTVACAPESKACSDVAGPSDASPVQE